MSLFPFGRPFLLDGATGTNLMAAGMPSGVCVEQWVLEHPDVLLELQRGYVEAGSGMLTAPTFEANPYKLSQHGLEGRMAEMNAALVALSKEAAQGRALVAGNLAPTGLFVEPFGDETFEGLCGIFRAQAFALKDAGVDYIACETFMGLTEARAALLAAKETGLPVTVTLTVEESGKTLSGGDVLANLVTLAAMGADAVGLNCSTGPEVILRALGGLAGSVPVPLIAKPNAGVPAAGAPGSGVPGSGAQLDPEEFAAYAERFLAQGVGILGGCCGTTPAHIAALRAALAGRTPAQLPSAFANATFTNATFANAAPGKGEFLAASEKQAFFLSEETLEFSHKLPCGPDLGDELLELEGAGRAARVVISSEEDAREFGSVAYLAAVPVILLGYDAQGLEEALCAYQGRALLDSRSDLPRETLEALAKRYGAILI